MKKLLLPLLLIILMFALLLLFPSPIDPVAWTPPKNEGMTGHFQMNDLLDNMEYLVEGFCVGCEDLAFDASGTFVYGGEIDGDILKIDLKTSEVAQIASTNGRPLGIQFHPNGKLIIADAIQGLISLDVDNGSIEKLTKSYRGEEMMFVDDLDIDSSGLIYFSDASNKYGYDQTVEDLMERRPNGALYSFNLITGETKLLLDDLYFANGVALADDESFLLVNETGNFSISKYWLKGDNAGQRQFLHDNLPGFPDNVTRGSNGIFWLTLIAPREQSTDDLMPRPFLRKILMKLPKSLHPAPVHYACIIGLDGNGNIRYNYQSAHPKFVEITSVTEHEGEIYFGSLSDTGITKLPITYSSDTAPRPQIRHR